MNENFWKDRYQGQWELASERERIVKHKIEATTGCRLISGPGLGVARAEYIPGAARRHGAERGGADWQIEGSNIYIEVTGPLSPRVQAADPLWIRPDKIDSAMAHPERDIWVVHALHDNETLRVVHIDHEFKLAYQNQRFRIVHPRIRGTRETYVQIPARSKYVKPFNVLLDFVRTVLSQTEQS